MKIVGVNPIMHNVSKWSDTLQKLSVSKRIVLVNPIMHNASKWLDTDSTVNAARSSKRI